MSDSYREILAARPTVDRMGRPIRWRDPYERMMANTERQPNGCIVCTTTAKNNVGHRTVGVQGATGNKIGAHRVAWEHFYGPIPDGLVVRHKCDNPPCVNVEHLELGTQADNMQDARDRGRWKPTPPDKNNRSTMTRESVRELRRLHREGWTVRELADRFGISLTSSRNIIIRQRWGWLPDDDGNDAA